MRGATLIVERGSYWGYIKAWNNLYCELGTADWEKHTLARIWKKGKIESSGMLSAL